MPPEKKALFARAKESAQTKRPRGSERVLGKVVKSSEFARIATLPRRELNLDSYPDVTPIFRKPGGTMSFWPIQSAALIEAAQAGGLFANIACGAGKTLICLALPEAMDSKKTVLLVKPDLKRQLEREVRTIYSKHFNLPLDRIVVVTYNELSSADHADVLEREWPDLVICDEGHCLRYISSARTKRVRRHRENNPGCRFCILSGTVTSRSVKDYGHLIEWVLGKNSPLPRGYRELSDWGGALDVKPDYRMAPGILLQFCNEGEDVREGYRRRLVQTPGVVATEEGAIGSSLIIRKLSPKVPPKIEALLESTKKTWKLEGEVFESILRLSQVLRQISCGFYYRWAWPDGKPDFEWLDARRDWHTEVREKLSRAKQGMDSPLLLARAAERYLHWRAKGAQKPMPDNAWPSETWEAWKAVKDRDPPPTEAVWLDDFVVDAAIAWAKAQEEPGIIWYQWKALGERIAQKGRFLHYGAGKDASELLAEAISGHQPRARIIVCSIAAQGTGKNLQRFSRNLFTTLPPNGTTFEQVAARTHRPGQLADEVFVDWNGHTPALAVAMEKVIEDAKYMQETTGQRQKVLYATRIGEQ